MTDTNQTYGLVLSTNDGRYLTHLINLAANFEMEHPQWFTKFLENGDQFDSGISSPSTSLSDEKFKHASLQCLLDQNISKGVALERLYYLQWIAGEVCRYQDYFVDLY
jgi:hypothetical protein